MSIASQSLTMTDAQPNNPSSIQPNPGLNHYPSQVSTNHVRVHATHDHEHSYYNSFTLCRGCTCSPWVMITLEKPNHYRTAQWLYLACNIPTEVSPPVWASHPPRSPHLCLMGSSCHCCTHTTPRFTHRSFTKHPSDSAIAASLHNRLVRQD
jgi:hypothetical protein